MPFYQKNNFAMHALAVLVEQNPSIVSHRTYTLRCNFRVFYTCLLWTSNSYKDFQMNA